MTAEREPPETAGRIVASVLLVGAVVAATFHAAHYSRYRTWPEEALTPRSLQIGRLARDIGEKSQQPGANFNIHSNTGKEQTLVRDKSCSTIHYDKNSQLLVTYAVSGNPSKEQSVADIILLQQATGDAADTVMVKLQKSGLGWGMQVVNDDTVWRTHMPANYPTIAKDVRRFDNDQFQTALEDIGDAYVDVTQGDGCDPVVAVEP